MTQVAVRLNSNYQNRIDSFRRLRSACRYLGDFKELKWEFNRAVQDWFHKEHYDQRMLSEEHSAKDHGPSVFFSDRRYIRDA